MLKGFFFRISLYISVYVDNPTNNNSYYDYVIIFNYGFNNFIGIVSIKNNINCIKN